MAIGDDDLLDALSRRIDPAPPATRAAAVTRRAFLAGLGIGIGTAGLIPGRSWAGPLVPLVQCTARGVTLRYRGRRWDLDRSAFGRRTRLRVQHDGGRIIICATRALLPGTDLRTDLTIVLSSNAGRWWCHLEIPPLGFVGERDLFSFLGGQPLAGRSRVLACSSASGSVRISAGRLEVRCRPSLQFAFAAPTRIDGPLQARGVGLTLDVKPRDQSIAGRLEATTGAYLTAFGLAQPVMRPRAFACAGSAHTIAVRHAELDALDGEFIDHAIGRSQLAVLTGPAGLDLIRDGAVEPLLAFDRAAMLVAPDRLALSGVVADDVFRIGLTKVVAEVRGRADGRAFRTVLRPGAANEIAADLDVETLLLPLVDGDHARLVTGRRPATMSGSSASFGAGDAPALAIEGGDDSAFILNDNDIHLRRGADLLDLRFRFSGFKLRQHLFGGAYLERLTDGKVCHPATITLELPPQHLGENTIDVADFDCPVPPRLDTFLAKPSRIVFKLPQQRVRDAVWRKVDVSIASLTDWEAIEQHLSVAPRATAGDSLDLQLKAAGLDTSQASNLAAYLARIEQTLLLPRPDETSLELADKLIFSPGPATKWEFPGRSPDAGRPMFGIRIGHRSDPRLRAIWSRRLDEQTLPALGTTDDLVNRAWGIVAQTSIYGLPALRRIVPNDGTGGIAAALAQVPRGGVVRPDTNPPPRYLAEIDQLLEDHRLKLPGEQPPVVLPPETGIALATTFNAADVTMTSLGTTMRIDWRGEPPVYEPTPALTDQTTGLPRSVRQTALERLFYSTWLERDEVVISATKGFLLPIGFRATLLETQKRAYVPDPGRPGHTVAIDVRRRRIVTRRPIKSFPALNQPDGGRDWPMSQATLNTDFTPLLVNPATTPDELTALRAQHKLRDWQVFWPRFHPDATTTADVEWKIQVEADASPMTARMIFIDSEVVPVDYKVADVVAAYNKYSVNDWPANKTARLNGARRRYADAKKPQDTSFDTDSWLLGARGRSLGDTEYFIMDARMNGADQPPFYPSVRRTKVSVQSIDRLVGSPQGLIECQPDPVFVRNGFTGIKDPEIFLDVVRPEIAFNVMGVPGSSMGVATPITLVAALSRSTGIVGGTPKQAKSAPAMLADPGTSDLQLDFDQARNNKFSISEFMPKLKILGIDFAKKFADVVLDSLADGPKLIETFNYGVEETEAAALDEIKGVAAEAVDFINRAFNIKCPKGESPCGIEAAIKAVDEELKKKSNLTFEGLYPDFYKAYLDAKAAVPPALQEIAGAASFDGVVKGASDTIVAAKPFIAAIETLVENPVPQIVERVISDLTTLWQSLQGDVRSRLRAFLDETVVKLVEQVVVPVFAAATADELELALGVAIDPATIAQFLLDPSSRPQIEQAFLYDQLGAPLAKFADILSELVQGFEGRVLLERARLLATVAGVVARGERAIHARLDPMVAGSIAEPGVQAALAGELLGIVDTVLAALQPNPASSDSLIAQLGKLRQHMAGDVRDRLRAALAAHPERFPALAGDTAAAIANDFVKTIGDDLTVAVVDAAKLGADRAEQIVRQYEVGIDRQVQRIAQLIVSVVLNAIDLGALPRLARAASVITDWCTGAQKPVLAGLALADGLLGNAATIDRQLLDLVQKAALVPGPTQPPQAVQAFEAARKDLLAAARDLMEVAAALAIARQQVRDLQKSGACVEPTLFARAVETAIRTRNQAIPPLNGVLAAIDRMWRAAFSATMPSGPNFLAAAPTLADIRELGSSLLQNVTTIGKAGAASDWVAVTKAIDALRANVSGFGPLFDKIDTEVAAITKQADDARKAIVSADASELDAIGEALARDYIFRDLRLSGLILQTIAFTSASLQRLDDAELGALKLAAAGLAKFEHAIAVVGTKLLENVNKSEFLRYLISLAGVTDLLTASQKLESEATLLDMVAAATTADDAIAIVDPIITAWKNKHVPLIELYDQVVRMVDILFQGNFAKLVGDEVRQLAATLRDQLADVIKRFVPTSVSTSFNWTTKIEPDEIFKIQTDPPEGYGEDHLVLSSLVSYDFTKNKSTVALNGHLRAFSITLPHMAQIDFGPATFTGGTGQKTSFDVQVRNVTLLDYLYFLEALTAWMKPQGNGVYVVPTFANIKVGYQFSSDIIMVGNLEFINIAIDVFALLPFDNKAAVFGFDFASEEKPFIIACAPYGGGGYLQIRTDASGSITDMNLSFLFGACVAFQFSFLSGTGRIFVGFAFKLKKKLNQRDGMTVQAIVEAVGEGHIACFSLTIFIRIVCTHTEDGDLDGTATYRFSFKVGFFSMHYQVTANRHIAGSKKSSSSQQSFERRYRPALAGRAPPAQFTISTSAPLKTRYWDDYRQHIALDLIDDDW